MILSRRLIFLFVLALATFTTLYLYPPSVSKERLRKLPNAVAQKVGLGEWAGYTDDSGLYIPTPAWVPGTVKAAGEAYRRVLIIARTKDEDISWMDEEIPDVEKVVYVADDPTAEYHPPENKGHEVMIYLTYLIEHYDELPDVMMFMHAHRWTWHNNDILNLDAMQMVRRLSSERVTREGYMNMRCQWFPGCPDWMHPGETEQDVQKTEQHIIAKAWAELFPLDPVPTVLAQACCAQFALSRERVRSIPRERFIFYRNWLLRTKLLDFVSGRVWEYMWQYVFTGQSFWCPAEHACYCDGYGVCFGGKAQYDSWWELRRERNRIDGELKTWEDKRKEMEETSDAQRKMELAEEAPDGKDVELKPRLETMDRELNDRAVKAVSRGNDPRNRAMEAGRAWNEGDGF